MKTLKSVALFAGLIAMFLIVAVGYTVLTDSLSIDGSVEVGPAYPDIYITSVTPDSSAGVEVYNTNGTVFFAKVTGSGTATFSVNFINISDKVYIYERVIDGVEIGIEGVYAGTDITYNVSGINFLDEIKPNGGMLSLDITITVPRNVTAEQYVLKFNFIEKTGTEILPGNDEYDITFEYNNGQPSTTVTLHENEFVPRP